MSKRKPIPSKVRFEVFKRDKFTCRYCGRTTPQVVLEVDHIVPVAEGGTDDIENLVTSCYECNRGKGATSLDELPVSDDDIHERTVLLLEREMQLREYNEVRRQVREREEAQAMELYNYWFDLWGAEKLWRKECPDHRQLVLFLRSIAVEDIKRAMQLAVAGDNRRTPRQALLYLYGILHRWRREGVDP
ncbi:MAG: HNH endonuclease [Bacillota bacterium]